MAKYDKMKEIKDFDNSKIGVKGLSDSGTTTIPKFFIHPPETLSDLKPSAKTVAIPVIDLSNEGTNRTEIVKQVREAAGDWGFFQVVNHGVPVSILEETIAAVKAFHELPAEIKGQYYKREERKGVMYSSNNDLYRSKAATWHDYLQVWMSPDPVVVEDIPTICRRELVDWDTHAKRVIENVMELLSEGLGLVPNRFKELTLVDERIVVGIIYPHCPQPDLTVGLIPHTDPGIITLLLANQIGGLQVKHGDDGWVDVKPLPGGLIINIGDFLQIVSNGEYKSVQHRVLANTSKEPRISVVEFFNLTKWRDSDKYGPLSEILTDEKPAIYRDFTQEEFMQNFYSKGLDSKSLVDKIKIHNI
ncbi:1-aminocyclopropane-1-carboxylate oxidase homolog 6-like [Impatiens glandulifera]|uniref:1-aminocyclopropane-1-carboxylate oxidase homolog 6-like n=1 Tax=Impatiens glandulifera TaxID=253017 RepID=UPI001FB17B63|nr:1-aminocyclopropane-1-carboxylate oxidase homolog 6-like [Impatiens glandulifera]